MSTINVIVFIVFTFLSFWNKKRPIQKLYQSFVFISLIEYIKLDRDKSTFKSHRDFSSEKEITFKHL